jgi:hypothetical protein
VRSSYALRRCTVAKAFPHNNSIMLIISRHFKSAVLIVILIKMNLIAAMTISNAGSELKNSTTHSDNHKSDNSVVVKNSEARETRWSYFYIGQWVWHFPLWFTLYFVFYLVFCTIRSIYNHTVSTSYNESLHVTFDLWFIHILFIFIIVNSHADQSGRLWATEKEYRLGH